MFLIILAFWWSTSGQFVGRAGQLFIFDLKFGISGSAYPIFYVKVTLFRDKIIFGRHVVDQWSLSGQGWSIMFYLTRHSDAVG